MNRKLKSYIWFVDAREVGTIWYGLCLSANDLARIGLLCLNKGKYNGKQIISENYIDEMIKKQKLKMTILGKYHMDYYGRLLILKKIYTAQVIVLIYINNSNNFICWIITYFEPSIFDRIDFTQKYLDK